MPFWAISSKCGRRGAGFSTRIVLQKGIAVMIPDRGHIHTEQRSRESVDLDRLPTQAAVELMHRADQQAVEAVGTQAASIAAAVDCAADCLAAGGRIIYVGAGTSGRLGVLDAAECPPTFSLEPGKVIGIIAGGAAALTTSIESVEDDASAGGQAIRDLQAGPQDMVLGIAAGGTTHFVLGALEQARLARARTAFLFCTDRRHITAHADIYIALPTGPEIITGSTRLKAGTATKLVLNTISTLAMVKLGKTFSNFMVDLDASKNTKLRDRAARIITQVGGLPRDRALRLLDAADGNVKRALVMHKRAVTPSEADRLLQAADGRLARIIPPVHNP